MILSFIVSLGCKSSQRNLMTAVWFKHLQVHLFHFKCEPFLEEFLRFSTNKVHKLHRWFILCVPLQKNDELVQLVHIFNTIKSQISFWMLITKRSYCWDKKLHNLVGFYSEFKSKFGFLPVGSLFEVDRWQRPIHYIFINCIILNASDYWHLHIRNPVVKSTQIVGQLLKFGVMIWWSSIGHVLV